jgi:hypothetical protein
VHRTFHQRSRLPLRDITHKLYGAFIGAFALQPFTGSTHSGESAEKWLDKFRRYVAFKKIAETDQVQLFHLLMRDQAADWLAALPDARKMYIQDLMHEFMKRHELSRVEKWRQTADLWKRRQAVDESVDDYVASMQAAARRINMATESLIDAIIQGLLPQIRLHVLHTGADSIESIFRSCASFRGSSCGEHFTTQSSGQING